MAHVVVDPPHTSLILQTFAVLWKVQICAGGQQKRFDFLKIVWQSLYASLHLPAQTTFLMLSKHKSQTWPKSTYIYNFSCVNLWNNKSTVVSTVQALILIWKYLCVRNRSTTLSNTSSHGCQCSCTALHLWVTDVKGFDSTAVTVSCFVMSEQRKMSLRIR